MVSIATQIRWLLWRSSKKLIHEWRPELLEFLTQLIYAVMLGFFFFQLNQTQSGLHPRLSLAFFATIRIAFTAVSAVPMLFIERQVLYRQVAAHYYVSPALYTIQYLMYVVNNCSSLSEFA